MFKSTVIPERLKRQSAQPWKPHSYQKKSVKWLLSRRGAALFLDPGLGKTSITYAAIKVLKSEGLTRGALVVAPRRPATLTWPEEQRIWKDFNDLRVVLLHGDKKDITLATEEADVWVITYEGLEWLFKPPVEHHKKFDPKKRPEEQAAYDAAHARYKEELKVHQKRLKLLFSKVDILVFDELSKMKHSTTVRFKILKPHLGRFERRWGLTGSPATNGLTDLFGQAYVLDLGASLGAYITHFRAQFFNLIAEDKDDPFPKLVPKPGADEIIYERMKNLALRIDAEDHLELPQILYVPMRFDLPLDIRKMYNELERDMILRLPSEELITVKTAATLSQKCRQLTSGAIYEDLIDPLTGEPRTGKRRYHAVHNLKLDMLDDLIDELQGNQLMCGYEFVHEALRLRERRKGDTVAFVGGGTSDAEAERIKNEWNAGRIRELYGHPGSIGHGLNLQKSSAHHVCWFSGTWDYELWDQFIRRLKRQGNTAKTLYLYMFIARDTVDEAVWTAMQRKRHDQNTLLDALKEYRSGRK